MPAIDESQQGHSNRGALTEGRTGEPRAESRWHKLRSMWGYLISQEAFRRNPILTLSRLILWRIRCLSGHGVVVRLRRWNTSLYLPPNWRGVEKLVYTFRERYEPELHHLDQILSVGQTFVDVGACYGVYALAASRLVGGNGRVLAFEPATRAFRILQKNVESSCLTNVLAYPIALTANKGKAWLYHHPNVGCDSLGRDPSFTDTGEEVTAETLDGVLREVGIHHVDVIKMDVQGAEELVLRGAAATLRSQRPVIIFEVFPEGTAALRLAPYGAWNLLENLGYRFLVVDRHGRLVSVNVSPDNRNVVAVYRK